jgi:hypothetical protein
MQQHEVGQFEGIPKIKGGHEMKEHKKDEVQEAKDKLVELIMSPSMGKNRADVEATVGFVVDVLMEKKGK